MLPHVRHPSHSCFLPRVQERGRTLLAVLASLVFACVLRAADTYPPAPAHYFNDYATVTHADTVAQLDEKLKQFERDTSNQLVVAVFPKFPSQNDVAPYSTALFRAWNIGQAKNNNGVGLFVWVQDRKMFIATGTGLEGALPDATCSDIIENEIKPKFKTGDYDGGLTAGVNAIIAATKGEYKGSGKIHSDGGGGSTGGSVVFWFIVLVVVILIFNAISQSRRGYTSYGRYGRRSSWGPFIGGFGGGGGFGDGGGGFGGGGGFSGGGGSSSGGGAGGSW